MPLNCPKCPMAYHFVQSRFQKIHLSSKSYMFDPLYFSDFAFHHLPSHTPAFRLFLCLHLCVFSHSAVFDSLWPHGARQAPLSVDFSRQEYGVGCYFLLQGIFPTQRLNLCLWHLLHWARRFITVPPGNCNILNISVSGHVLAACSLEKTYSQDTDITFFSWKSTGLTLSFHSNITLWQTFCGSPINIVTFHSLQALGH